MLTNILQGKCDNLDWSVWDSWIISIWWNILRTSYSVTLCLCILPIMLEVQPVSNKEKLRYFPHKVS